MPLQPHSTLPRIRASVLTAGVLIALFFAAAAPLIHSGYSKGRAAYDQRAFYGATVLQFLAQWPRPGLGDYPAATTPGYYLAIAAAAQVAGTGLRTLQFLGSLFTAGLLITLAVALCRRANALMALALCLPVLCSPYVFPGGVWMLPDGAGWWGVLCVMLVALKPRVDARTYISGGLALLALVMVRQTHLWTAAPLCAAAWLGSGENAGAPFRVAAPRGRRLALMACAIIPSILAIAWFVRLWHGMVPPNQASPVAGGNWAAPAMALATAGMLGVFYAPIVLPRLRGLRWMSPALAGTAAGAIIGAIPITTYSMRAGRFSGIWNIVRHMPYIANRSPPLIALAAFGGLAVALWLLVLPLRQRWIWAVAVAAFLVAQIPAHYAFQRYYEPFVLIAAAVSLSRLPGKTPRWPLAGPIVLAVLLAGVTWMSLR